MNDDLCLLNYLKYLFNFLKDCYEEDSDKTDNLENEEE